MAETTGLLNRRAGQPAPRVRISSSPPGLEPTGGNKTTNPARQILAGFFLFQGMVENSLKPVPEQVAEPENLRSRQATIYP